MTFLSTVAAFILALGVLIVVHEYGHYLAARWCGVKVLRFSVGFGRPLVLRRRGADQTEWAIGAFPLGGYVKMLDEREAPVAAHELARAFNRQSVAKRSLIVAAGPAANFILAIALYWLLYSVGVPGMKAIIAAPPAGTPAALAGFKSGERVTRVAEEPVNSWQDLRWVLLEHAVGGAAVSIETIDEHGGAQVRELSMASVGPDDLEHDFLAKVGLTAFRPRLQPIIGEVVDGGAAARAGLSTGDKILAVDGAPIADWDTFVARVRGSAERPLRLTLQRGAQSLQVTVTPAAAQAGAERIGRIGAGVEMDPEAEKLLATTVRHHPARALAEAVKKTWDMSVFSLKMLLRMVIGEVSWRNLSGPVTIADYAGQSARLGWLAYVSFVALVSISLGVLNLLPIPLLDGGHLMYYMLETIKGSPVSERVMEIGQQIGMAILFVLMLFAFYNDINRLVSG